ncbi:MAG: hypothetical protein ABIK65_10280 [Candidatus Eisenbacteria bacterium]
MIRPGTDRRGALEGGRRPAYHRQEDRFSPTRGWTMASPVGAATFPEDGEAPLGTADEAVRRARGKRGGAATA